MCTQNCMRCTINFFIWKNIWKTLTIDSIEYDTFQFFVAKLSSNYFMAQKPYVIVYGRRNLGRHHAILI